MAATTVSEQYAEVSVQQPLGSAVASLARLRGLLGELVAKANRLNEEYLAEQRDVREALDGLPLSIADQTAPGSSYEEAVRRASTMEQRRDLQQRQEWIGERVVETQAASSKLRAVLRQLETSASFLANDVWHETGGSGYLPITSAVQAREEERHRLAREVHDGPAQALANAVFQVEYCEQLAEKDPRKTKQELARLKVDLRESLAEVRYFISDLRPAALEKLGLAAALRRLVSQYESSFGIPVELDVAELARFSAAYELAIFRVVQEALQNIRKHSRATAVRMGLGWADGALVVTIEDNGVGFDPERAGQGTARHFGLLTMRERAEVVGATLDVASSPGRGTRVELKLPRAKVEEGLKSQEESSNDGGDNQSPNS